MRTEEEVRTDILTATYSTKSLRAHKAFPDRALGIDVMAFGAGWEAALKWWLNDKGGREMTEGA